MEVFIVLQGIGFIAFGIAMSRVIKTFGNSPECNEDAIRLLVLPLHPQDLERTGEEYFIIVIILVAAASVVCFCMNYIMEVCRSCLFKAIKEQSLTRSLQNCFSSNRSFLFKMPSIALVYWIAGVVTTEIVIHRYNGNSSTVNTFSFGQVRRIY